MGRFEMWGEHFAIDLPGARAVFTTRRGGFSSGPFHSLNLGRLTSDSPEAVERNRGRLAEQVGRRLAMVHQVHGATIRPAESLPEGPDLAQADGILSSSADLAPTVLVADCLPVAVAGEGAVAMLHAGWRGLAAGVLTGAVTALRDQGAADGALVAAIGPGIRSCCYEVGQEVHDAFASYGAGAHRGRHLDLAAIAGTQLHRAGVAIVHDLGLCTSCRPELFFSHRRDRGLTGRQAGAAWLT